MRRCFGNRLPLLFLAAALELLLAAPRPPSAFGDDATPLTLRVDDAPNRLAPALVKGSHVKVYIPCLPYLYTSHAINGALIKPSDNARGWEYDMAVSHRQINDTTYEFSLRKGVLFQDGTPFNADAVVLNMEYFKKKPTLYSKIDKVFDRAEKLDDYTVRIHLTEKYGSFMNDAIWMQFYTKTYLEKFGWNGKANCPNLAEPGPYGLGPYVLKEGYIEGDRHTAKAVLVANPYYWNKEYPKVETITVYTELDAKQAREWVLNDEGKLDIAVIPPEDKVAAVLGPYSKLVTSAATDNIAIHINMRDGNPKLLDKGARLALNEALNRPNLLHFVYEDEGVLSPISPLFPGVKGAAASLHPYPSDAYDAERQKRLKSVLDSLRLKVLTQDRFLPLWRGIEYQLKRVGVALDVEVVKSEAEIFGPLLKTNARKNEKQWDLLVWGNDDWYFNHPWTAFFVYDPASVWCTTEDDAEMKGYIDAMFRASVDEPEFPRVCEKIMRRAYDNGDMLYVPTPNKVFAVNKEVVFEPYKMACMPLWKIQVTDQHWSVRRGPYPEALRQPVRILRMNAK